MLGRMLEIAYSVDQVVTYRAKVAWNWLCFSGELGDVALILMVNIVAGLAGFGMALALDLLPDRPKPSIPYLLLLVLVWILGHVFLPALWRRLHIGIDADTALDPDRYGIEGYLAWSWLVIALTCLDLALFVSSIFALLLGVDLGLSFICFGLRSFTGSGKRRKKALTVD